MPLIGAGEVVEPHEGVWADGRGLTIPIDPCAPRTGWLRIPRQSKRHSAAGDETFEQRVERHRKRVCDRDTTPRESVLKVLAEQQSATVFGSHRQDQCVPHGHAVVDTQVEPALEAAGGRYLARGGAHKVYEGDWEPRRIVVLEFPSVQSFEQFYNGPVYRGLKPIRDACSSARLVCVEGLDA